MLISLLACTVAVTAYRQQFPLPGITVPSGWGVNIHFNDPKPGEMELLARGGNRWVRQDLSWHLVEKEKNNYDFAPLARLFDACKRNGVRPYIILDYGNDLYQTGSPRTPESRKGFCDMVAALMTRFKGQGAIWEMWNEPNIFFWQPGPSAEQYISLAIEVGKTIRRVAPDEWYVGPATSGMDWQFLDKCFKAGLLGYWDAVSVHPYRNNEPESVTADWAKLRSMVDRYKPVGKTVPMISGEWGYSELYSGLSLELQSKYVTRQYLTNLMNGVGLSVWYDWKDDGKDPKEPEHHFGSVYSDLASKPTYLNKKALAEALDGYTYSLRLAQASEGDYVLAFRKGKSVKFAVWTTGAASSITLPDGQRVAASGMPVIVDAKPGRATDLVLAWHALPASLAVGSPRDAISASQALRTGVPKGATLTTPVIQDTVVATPMRARVQIRKGDVTLAQTTTIDRTRPLVVQLAPSRAGLSLIVRNPGGRAFRGQVALQVGKDRRVREIEIRPSDKEKWLALGSVDGELPITLSFGSEKVLSDVRVRMLPPFAEGRFGIVDDGDPKLKGAYETTINQEFRVKYSFPVGWKFFQIVPKGELAKPVAGKPISLGMWVWSDGKGDLLRIRYTDASGQTFQPDNGVMDWKGWRFVSIPIDGLGGRWGGINDGVVHYPISLTAVALVDSPGGRGGSGEVAIRDISLITK